MGKVVLVDPPSGWKYGFPKEAPEDLFNRSDREIQDWFLRRSYPSVLINKGMLDHCRYWYEEKDDG